MTAAKISMDRYPHLIGISRSKSTVSQADLIVHMEPYPLYHGTVPDPHPAFRVREGVINCYVCIREHVRTPLSA